MALPWPISRLKITGATPTIDWSPEARADVRRLDRRLAMRIFDHLLDFDRTGHGDVKDLQGQFTGYSRLRVGDYRVVFSRSADLLYVACVKHRRDAYR